MSNEMPPTDRPSQSAPSSLSPSRPWAESLPGALTAGLAIWVVGRPLGQALPGLIEDAGKTNRWWPVVADLLALGLLVAPVPTLALARSLLSRLIRTEEPKRKD